MEIDEIQSALKAIASEIGPRAIVNISISASGDHYGFCYPRGHGKDDYFMATGKTFADIIEGVRAKWAERAALASEQTIRDMALAIVRITYDTGSCSDAQLRGDGFDASDILRFGDQAVTRANEMADKGPFSITVAPGANDAVAA